MRRPPSAAAAPASSDAQRMPEPARTPAEFAAVISGDDPPLMVGGQAVNIWAELYAQAAPELAEFEPFVSRDADIFGTRALAVKLAAHAGWECLAAKRGTVTAAILVKLAADGSSLVVEVLDEVNGLNDADLALHETVEARDGKRYRLLSPLVMLKAKLYNLISLVGQERPQDLRHVRMLLTIVPHYLHEMAAEVRTQKNAERDLLGAIRYLGEVIRLPWVGNAVRAHGLDLRAMFPAWLREACPTAAQASLDAITLPK